MNKRIINTVRVIAAAGVLAVAAGSCTYSDGGGGNPVTCTPGVDCPGDSGEPGDQPCTPGINCPGDSSDQPCTTGVNCPGDSGGPAVTPGVAAALVNGPGEAWIDVDFVRQDGFILSADGSFTWISDVTGAWTVSGTGKVSAQGGKFIVIQGQPYYGFEAGLDATYLLSNNTLTLTNATGVSVRFKKTTVGVIAGVTPPHLIKGK